MIYDPALSVQYVNLHGLYQEYIVRKLNTLSAAVLSHSSPPFIPVMPLSH